MGRKSQRWENRRAAELTAQGVPAWEAMDQAAHESKVSQRTNRSKTLKEKRERQRRKRDRKRNRRRK